MVPLSTVPLPAADFVRTAGRQFTVAGAPYVVCGTNLWYGALLGRPSNPAGRARLLRELDRLQTLGVNNLRVLGAGERCAVPGTLRPALQTAPGEYDEDVLQGLDFLVAEAGNRGMRLVVFLNNYWDWSGGMAQYLAWATGEPAVGVHVTEWRTFNATLSRFYTNQAANALYRQHIATLLARRNTITGRRYRDEPAIMAWELANEPRPGERAGERAAVWAAFVQWVDATSRYIHSLDANHLVTTGSEGRIACADQDDNFRELHALPGIDYAVFHLWPKNWRWFDSTRPTETIEATLAKTRDYVLRHFAQAAALDKPVVCEEFGLDRDGGLGLDVPTTCRDRFYAAVYALTESSRSAGGPAAGTNFWLWGGEGRPPEFGDTAADGIGAGDMLQEEPGRNTVFAGDASTLEVIRGHFARLQAQRIDALPARGGLGKTAYLTIDDGPTEATPAKLGWLVAQKIPAVLFCPGWRLEKYRDMALAAIRQGFIIANHSYSHPFFSQLSVAECAAEIRRTDAIIESLYAEAGVPRPAKFFRFPYLDKGARTGADGCGPEEAERKAAIQASLREQGYGVPALPGVTWPEAIAGDADWGVTYDVKEWSVHAPYPGTDVRTEADVFRRMNRTAPDEGLGLNSPGAAEVILLHDHPETDALFPAIVAALQAKELRFALPP